MENWTRATKPAYLTKWDRKTQELRAKLDAKLWRRTVTIWKTVKETEKEKFTNAI